MADLLGDAVDQYSPNASSILDKLPGRRLDAYIRNSTQRGIPQQGATTGGLHSALRSYIPHPPLPTVLSRANSNPGQEMGRHE